MYLIYLFYIEFFHLTGVFTVNLNTPSRHVKYEKIRNQFLFIQVIIIISLYKFNIFEYFELLKFKFSTVLKYG